VSIGNSIFADRLIEAIQAKGSPICVGIDPVYEQLPDAVAGPVSDRNSNNIDTALDAIFQFTTGVLKTVAPHVPIVKFQSAWFEKYRWEGVEAYFSLIAEARELGLLVIGDVKRGDIGATSAAYADAHLGDHGVADEERAAPDAITINPMLGMDTIEPFVAVAKAHDRGLFVLVRNSNPGAAELQDVLLHDGRTWSEMLADRLALLAADAGLVGRYGYSSLGAVVGATQPHTMASLRRRLPKSIFLLPGYGAQGATAEMTRLAFDAQGQGAIVSASRSILNAHQSPRYGRAGDWTDSVLQATLAMKADLASVLEMARG
jgi:orotidine-5'-phosphate decarboxylase